MKAVKRIGAGLKGFALGIASIPKDVKRYMTMRRM